MTEFEDRLRKYGTYLEQKAAEHMANSKFESLHGSIAEEGQAVTLRLARDTLYEIFPEIKPADYKTVAGEDAERDAKHRKNLPDFLK